MSTINLENLYRLQGQLDDYIAKNHNITYATTFSRRLLALLVELGELANETRVFKYWSNKPSSQKEVILAEFADGLHFLLSLGIPLQVDKLIYDLEPNDVDLSVQFIAVYKASLALDGGYTKDNYYLAMEKFLTLGVSLGLTVEEIVEAYLAKLKTNYKRQDTGY